MSITDANVASDIEKQRRANAELATHWLAEIERQRKREKKWRETAKKVIERYRDDRNDYEDNTSRFNILWANTEILKAAVLKSMPIPDVRRRYLTQDPAARTAALILERAIGYCLSQYDVWDVLKRVREDYLLGGRGQAYVCYEPLMLMRPTSSLPPGDPEGQKPENQPLQEQQPQQEQYKAWETVCVKYIRWDMYGFSDCAQWSECPAQWWGEYMTKDQVKRAFPEFQDLDELPFIQAEQDHSVEDDKDKQPTNTVAVWKVWHKDARKYMVFVQGYQVGPIKMVDDPLQLENFYPTGEPIYSLKSNNQWTPKPDFCQYQDQANELDVVVNRLRNLVSALKVRGVYDQAMDAVAKFSDLIRDPDLTMKPVPNFRELAEKGGLSNLMDFMPLEDISKAIEQLREREGELKNQIYEIMGISDIIRGSSDASETLGAQQLKAQYGGLRVSTRQEDMQGFIRDILRIMGEIIAEHFSPDTLRLMCGIEVIPDAAFEQMKAQDGLPTGAISQAVFQQACQIIQSDKLRGFKVDIETDSTIPVDKKAEQDGRVAFMGAVGQYLQGVIPAVQSGAIPMKVAREGLLFVVRGFKIGTELEEVLEELGQDTDTADQLAKMKQMQAQMQQEMAALKQENSKLKEQSAGDMARAQTDIQISTAKAQNDIAVDNAQASNTMMLDRARAMGQQRASAN